ncbi:MAG: NAD-dependent epimerase/dehydratase family protein [Deltaproteobacteria bacterium]|nr:NAD-dependent epimerase/dehydratase family protein [Deltaproteobacteria bacterium]
MEKVKILVTGATGFVGRNVIDELRREGRECIALIRNKQKAEKIWGKNIELRIADLRDRETVSSTFKGVDIVVHIAGLIKTNRNSEFYSSNVTGAENVARASSLCGVKKIIYVSSLSVQNPISHYGKSKLLAEKKLLQYKDGLQISILRPAVVYGPYDEGMYYYFKMAKRGMIPILRKERYISLIYVKDVARTINLLIDRDNPETEVFQLSDNHIYTWEYAARALFDSVNIKGKVIRFPEFSPYVFAYSSRVFSKIFKYEPILTIDKMREFMQKKWICNSSRLFLKTGFIPSYTIEKGFKKTAQWYIENDWL